MFPVLFKPFGFEVRAYGVLLMLGLVVAVFWARARAPRWGIDPERTLDAAFWGIIPGILFARLGYIVQEWDRFSQHPNELWSFRFEGLTSFGGVVGALLGIYVYTRRAKVPTLAFFDIASVPLLAAHAIGRLGCLLNGCCYGHRTEEWFGVRVIPLQGLFTPAQVFDSAYVLVGAFLILLFERRKRPDGQSIALTVLFWGVARFFYEFSRAGTNEEVARGAASSTYWGSLPITQAQGAALVMVVVGAALFVVFGRKTRGTE